MGDADFLRLLVLCDGYKISYVFQKAAGEVKRPDNPERKDKKKKNMTKNSTYPCCFKQAYPKKNYEDYTPVLVTRAIRPHAGATAWSHSSDYRYKVVVEPSTTLSKGVDRSVEGPAVCKVVTCSTCHTS